MPVAAVCGSIAAGLLIAGDLAARGTDYAALDPTEFSEIEFVARIDRPQSLALRDALDRTCGVTGCDADTLHPMLLASARRMTSDELEAALEAQDRIRAESGAVYDRALQGTASATMAGLEILAADRIAALYEMELEER